MAPSSGPSPADLGEFVDKFVLLAEFQDAGEDFQVGVERDRRNRDLEPGCLVTLNDSDVVALDFDGEEGLALRKKKNVYGAIPTSLTGKGCHCLFRYPGQEVRNGARLLPGPDIRGDGGFIVIPPSIHPSGKQCEWELPPWSVDELPELPEWVWPLLKRNDTIVVPPVSARAPVPDGLPPGVERGARNATAARVAGSLYKMGLAEGAVLTPIVCGAGFLSEWIDAPKTLVHPVILDLARVIVAGFAGAGKSSLATNLAAAGFRRKPESPFSCDKATNGSFVEVWNENGSTVWRLWLFRYRERLTDPH